MRRMLLLSHHWIYTRSMSVTKVLPWITLVISCAVVICAGYDSTTWSTTWTTTSVSTPTTVTETTTSVSTPTTVTETTTSLSTPTTVIPTTSEPTTVTTSPTRVSTTAESTSNTADSTTNIQVTTKEPATTEARMTGATSASTTAGSTSNPLWSTSNPLWSTSNPSESTTNILVTTTEAATTTKSPCSAGLFQPIPGQPCEPCPRGFFKPASGMQPCDPCPHGQYQGYIGQAECDLCAEGFNTTHLNSTSSEQCRTICEINLIACVNSGTCILNATMMVYECDCLPGLTGDRCQIDIDECQSSPCQKNGNCVNFLGGYECLCVDVKGITYAGVHCGQVVNVRPLVDRVVGLYGPQAGGTQINVTGFNFDEFPPIRVELDRRYRCDVISDPENPTFLTALTPAGNASDEDVPLSIDVIFQGGLRIPAPDTFTFQYKGNPNITDFYPQKTLIDGGTTISVMGESLDAVETTLIEITVEILEKIFINKYRTNISVHRTVFYDLCRASNNASSTILCLTPNMTSGIPEYITLAAEGTSNDTVDYSTDNATVNFFIGFKMDGLPDFKNISDNPNPALASKGQLIIVNTPEITRNPEVIDYQPGVLYILRGSRMTGIEQSDYRIEVGRGNCTITDLTDTSVTCQLPPPTPARRENSDLPSAEREIWVHLGINIVLEEMGYVRYVSLDLALVIGVTVAAVVLVTIAIVTAVCIVKRRNRQRRHEARRPRLDQMDDNEIVIMDPVPSLQHAEPSDRAVSHGTTRWNNARASLRILIEKVMGTKGAIGGATIPEDAVSGENIYANTERETNFMESEVSIREREEFEKWKARKSRRDIASMYPS